MTAWGYTEILPHYLQALSHHILGKFFDCNNYEFLDLERPHYFTEKIPALKQTLVFMSKILKKIFKDGNSQYNFQKLSLF